MHMKSVHTTFHDQLIVMIKSCPGLSASVALYITEILNILVINYVSDTYPYETVRVCITVTTSELTSMIKPWL